VFMKREWIVLWRDGNHTLHKKEFDSPFDARDYKIVTHPEGQMYHLIRW
jgi:hypothetical protein